MAIKQIYHGSPEYHAMVALRYKVLRQPLGLNFSLEELNKENDDILVANIEDDEVLGCCILTAAGENTLRLRQMAVNERFQKRGIGDGLLHYCEKIAVDKGYNRIVMHARDTAIGFYEKMGYHVFGEPFTEVNLPHHYMGKELRRIV